MSKKGEGFHYPGFLVPNTTPVPDDVFDVIAPELTEAELRVLLYVIRRTYGFKKQQDAIAGSQMEKGIITRDGRVLDRGTGMAKSAVWRGIKGLVDKGILTKTPDKTDEGDSAVNVYQLRFREGVVLEKNNPSSRKEQPVVLQKDTQESVNKNHYTFKNKGSEPIGNTYYAQLDQQQREILDHLGLAPPQARAEDT